MWTRWRGKKRGYGLYSVLFFANCENYCFQLNIHSEVLEIRLEWRRHYRNKLAEVQIYTQCLNVNQSEVSHSRAEIRKMITFSGKTFWTVLGWQLLRLNFIHLSLPRTARVLDYFRTNHMQPPPSTLNLKIDCFLRMKSCKFTNLFKFWNSGKATPTMDIFLCKKFRSRKICVTKNRAVYCTEKTYL